VDDGDQDGHTQIGVYECVRRPELVPNAAVIAVLVDPTFPSVQVAEVQSAARSIGQQVHILNASDEAELDTAFTIRVFQPST
jgi:hypothetical protein